MILCDFFKKNCYLFQGIHQSQLFIVLPADYPMNTKIFCIIYELALQALRCLDLAAAWPWPLLLAGG